MPRTQPHITLRLSPKAFKQLYDDVLYASRLKRGVTMYTHYNRDKIREALELHNQKRLTNASLKS